MNASSQDEDNGFNTSDEEFERQLEEAAIIQAEEKLERERRPKMKKGRGKNAKRRMKTHLKKTSSYPTGLDAEGYEVSLITLPSRTLIKPAFGRLL